MSDWRLTPDNAALVVVDPQEKLMAAMARRTETLAGIEKLLRAAHQLRLPTLVTLQYVKGLGPLFHIGRRIAALPLLPVKAEDLILLAAVPVYGDTLAEQ